MSDLNRQVAELEWHEATDWHPDTDANQIDAAVREWCAIKSDGVTDGTYSARLRREFFIHKLTLEVKAAMPQGSEPYWEYEWATATPEQKCRALIAAAKKVSE